MKGVRGTVVVQNIAKHRKSIYYHNKSKTCHHHHHHCAAIVSRGWAKDASIFAYLALSSARWYPSNGRLVRLSTVSPVFPFRRVPRW